jgi:Sec-independent protein translocase protein TatA
LADLHAYASRNDLPGLARKMEDALQEMRREMGDGEAAAISLPPPQRRVN